jgi:hypothetical protein
MPLLALILLEKLARLLEQPRSEVPLGSEGSKTNFARLDILSCEVEAIRNEFAKTGGSR